jgi:hypothetical protein
LSQTTSHLHYQLYAQRQFPHRPPLEQGAVGAGSAGKRRAPFCYKIRAARHHHGTHKSPDTTTRVYFPRQQVCWHDGHVGWRSAPAARRVSECSSRSATKCGRYAHKIDAFQQRLPKKPLPHRTRRQTFCCTSQPMGRRRRP